MVASETAKFGLPEVKRGLFAAGGGVFISTRIPLAVALELTLTGDPIDAVRAQALGLINQVVPQSGALDAALELAERIARNGPLALKATKEMVRTASTDLEKARALAAEWQPKVFGSRTPRKEPWRSWRSVIRCGRGVEGQAYACLRCAAVSVDDLGPGWTGIVGAVPAESGCSRILRRLERHGDPGDHYVGA